MKSAVRSIAVLIASFVPLLAIGQARSSPGATELIVLFDQDVPGTVLRAEDVVDAVESKIVSSHGESIKQRVGAAKSARPMTTDRLSGERRSALRRGDPQERLQRFVVLSYANADEAAEARAR